MVSKYFHIISRFTNFEVIQIMRGFAVLRKKLPTDLIYKKAQHPFFVCEAISNVLNANLSCKVELREKRNELTKKILIFS